MILIEAMEELGVDLGEMFLPRLVWFGLVTTAGYDPKTLLEIV